MKIRTDFVTNSSSSSFCTIISINLKNGKSYMYEYPDSEMVRFEECPGSCRFYNDLSDLLGNDGTIKKKYLVKNNVLNFLIDGIRGDYDNELAEELTHFFETEISSMDDISRIRIVNSYYAYGEGADLIPENDGELCELADEVMNTTGEKQNQALKKMLDYINTSSSERCCGEFADGYDDIFYEWSGDDSDLLELAKKLSSGYCIKDEYTGCEIQSIDLETLKVEKRAVFDLD